MTFIILDTYKREKTDECVEISPIDFINRGTCVSMCLVDEIFDRYDLTLDQEIYLENAEKFYGR